MEPGFAPAKINLALHVTGRRADGYHLLDSLVGFAGLGDQIAAMPARALSLQVSGPFAAGVPSDGGNLVLRAAEALRAARGVRLGATIRLTKTLPHAAGIGGGSSDAAATIRLLARMWNVAPLAPDDPAALALGADVPACLMAPQPLHMSGIGDGLAPAPGLPPVGLVLVNPRVEVPTAAVFAALGNRDNPGMDPLPQGADFDGFLGWLQRQRNDMQPAARAIAPEIGRALDLLSGQGSVHHAVMSGSGATCIGLCRDMGAARQAARAIQVREMGWWVVPAPLIGVAGIS